jgi:formylglycine-generating enzyme required for sulfatase activity
MHDMITMAHRHIKKTLLWVILMALPVALQARECEDEVNGPSPDTQSNILVESSRQPLDKPRSGLLRDILLDELGPGLYRRLVEDSPPRSPTDISKAAKPLVNESPEVVLPIEEPELPEPLRELVLPQADDLVPDVISFVGEAPVESSLDVGDIPVPLRKYVYPFKRLEGAIFVMGSPVSEQGRKPDEFQHEVLLEPFLISRYEVTQQEYLETMGNNPSFFKGLKLPVEQVTWYDAVAYCNARSTNEGFTPVYTITGEQVVWNRDADGYRLPTEAEWEYACRSGALTAFNSGSTIALKLANYNALPQGRIEGKTVPVDSFEPNAWGLFNMHGNVAEWCWDWYGDYPVMAQENPSGPATGGFRVTRGGGWNMDIGRMRSANRNYYLPSFRSFAIGFRLVRSGAVAPRPAPAGS